MNEPPKTARAVNAGAGRPLSQASLARELGISPAAITKLKGQGMPVHSADAARAWRAANLQAGRVRPDPGPSAATLVQRVHALAELADRALALERGFDAIAGELRRALRDVPEDARDCVTLSFDLWRALIGPHACGALDHGALHESPGALLGSEDYAGDAAYSLACGESQIR